MDKSTKKNYSYNAIEWLTYIELSTGLHINHAMNGGEVTITDPELVTKTKKPKKYYADGFCEETNTIYEFYGDFTHGNPKLGNYEIIQRKNIATKERENRLRELGYTVVTMWSSDWINSEERMMFLLTVKE